MLDAYNTVPQMLNFGIHVYFVLRDVKRMVRHTWDCAECKHGTHRHGSAREGYASLVEDVAPSSGRRAVPRCEGEQERAGRSLRVVGKTS